MSLSNPVLKHIARQIDPSYFELILLPTEQCNFRCKYCYEDFLIGKMSNRVIGGVKKLIEARIGQIKRLHITWFGGEPLVAKDVVVDISSYAKEICDKSGVKLTGSMTTNGYNLDLDTAKALNTYNVNIFQVSIDGSADIHDTTRVTASGKGTHERILKNLLALYNSDLQFEVIVRLHITRHNYQDIEAEFNRLRALFEGDKRFQYMAKEIANLGGAGGNAELAPEKNLAKLVAQRINNSGKRDDKERAAMPYVCYASRPNSLVIRADGSVAKCTVAFSANKNKLGYLKDDGTLDIEIEKMRAWMVGLESIDLPVLNCPASKVLA